MRNFVDILKTALRCEYVDKWLQTINIVIHNREIAQLIAPIHFYTYEQVPTITTTKTNKQSKKTVETDLSQNIYRASTIANIEYYKQDK